MVLAECSFCYVANTSSAALPLSVKDVSEAATAAISILQKHGIRSCLFGSMACRLYGVDYRDPKDVDLIVLDSDLTQEALKDLIVESSNGRFYSLLCKSPGESYRVLWYSLPSALSDTHRRCKIDILQPGNMEVPEIPNVQLLPGYNHLPVVPLILLILLKLNGWAKRRISDKKHWRAKVSTDVDDINKLLDLALGTYRAHISQKRHVPKPFWRLGEENARIYAIEHPGTVERWAELGFSIEATVETSIVARNSARAHFALSVFPEHYVFRSGYGGAVYTG